MDRWLWLCLAALAAGPVAASETWRVDSEPSRTQPRNVADAWRAEAAPVARLRYAELPASRILALQQRNEVRAGKPLQIGIAREALHESATGTLPGLYWTRLADGSHAARIELHSPLAYGIRAGLDLAGLHPRAELRVAGSEAGAAIVATVAAGQAARLRGDDGLYWTPATQGQTQTIELWQPAGAPVARVRIRAPRLSHLMSNAVDDFRILKNLGASGACNIDVACRAGELGAGFATARNAVARITFVRDGGSYLCTGTLLNDTVASSQIPWFHTAAHCVDSPAVAATVNSYWQYEAPACGASGVGPFVQLNGGADLLYASVADAGGTDGALLRLRDPAPAGATFAAWDAAPLASGSEVLAIHHPSGDVKKVSAGRHVASRSDAVSHAVTWDQGTTEGGSSGSALFTRSGSQYRLRGGLHGGDAMCTNSGGSVASGNIDWYSRFDQDFIHIRQYLAPPGRIRRNGAQPLAPPR